MDGMSSFSFNKVSIVSSKYKNCDKEIQNDVAANKTNFLVAIHLLHGDLKQDKAIFVSRWI